MNYLWIKVRLNDKNRLLLRCYKNKLFIFDSYEDEKYFYFKVKKEDKNLLKKISYTKIKVVDETGIVKVKIFFKKYYVFILSLIIGLIVFYLLTHLIVKVEIIHSNQEIRDLLTSALEKNGIKKNTWKKDFKEITKIKESILKEYPTKLEWLEIEVKGMKYIVRVEERKILEKEEVKTSCNIVAIKDGLVKKVIYSKGEGLVKTNDLVKKGDILISGTLKKDEEIKDIVCATGKVYAEVWYKATIKVPLSKIENVLTGKVRYNLKIKNNNYNDFIFKSRLKDYEEDTYPLFTLFNTTFFFVKQKEITKKMIDYNEDELKSLADNLLNEKIKQILNDNEEILEKKILQTNKLEKSLEVIYFVSLLEQIGEQQSF